MILYTSKQSLKTQVVDNVYKRNKISLIKFWFRTT